MAGGNAGAPALALVLAAITLLAAAAADRAVDLLDEAGASEDPKVDANPKADPKVGGGDELEGDSGSELAAAPAGDGDAVLELLRRLLSRLEAAADTVAEAVLDGGDPSDAEGALVEVRRVMCTLVNTRVLGGGCAGYLSSGPAQPPPDARCCRSVRSVFTLASSTPLSRRTLCSCLQDDARSALLSANAYSLLGLPLRCGVPAFAALPLLLDPAANCSSVIS